MKLYLDKLKAINPGVIGLTVIAVIAAIVIVVGSTKAKAQPSWSGCSFGGFGTYVAGLAIPDGSPFGLGANGQNAGVSFGCDVAVTPDKKLVAGFEASYAWLMGKGLNDLGIDHDLSLTSRLGYVFAPGAMPYVHAGWSRLDGSGGHIDGYKLGLGVEFKMATAVYGDVRWSHGIWDVPGLSGVDVSTDEVRVGMKIKLGPSLFTMADEPEIKTPAPKSKPLK